jgi:hypothetical protein
MRFSGAGDTENRGGPNGGEVRNLDGGAVQADGDNPRDAGTRGGGGLNRRSTVVGPAHLEIYGLAPISCMCPLTTLRMDFLEVGGKVISLLNF